MRVVYMGTPEIAAKVLEAVHELPVEIVGVWTQPDKPVDMRGKSFAHFVHIKKCL